LRSAANASLLPKTVPSDCTSSLTSGLVLCASFADTAFHSGGGVTPRRTFQRRVHPAEQIELKIRIFSLRELLRQDTEDWLVDHQHVR
jgi:hypothetical protein